MPHLMVGSSSSVSSLSMKILYLILLFNICKQGSGLRCWTCRQVATNSECIVKGSIETCGPNEACVNQETTIPDGDSKYEITKGCRRNNAEACLSNDRQNPGNYPTVCRQSRKTNVCSCCCNTDLCNGPQVECKDMITCRRPDKPGNGRIRCPRPITYGSACTIVCDSGYRRVGASKITCTNGTYEGYWSPRQSAACVAITVQQPQQNQRRCIERMQAPEHGSMICENPGRYKDDSSYNYMGTMCAFKCDPGYFRDGPESTQCLGGGRWNIAAPRCHKGMCQTPPQDQHRTDICSDGKFFESICDMRCKTGYMLIGSSTSTCRAINEFVRQGSWSSEFPRCVRAICHRQLMKPVNGEIVCTRRNILGSVCTFSCRRGFQLTNVNSAVECVRNGNMVEWNGQSSRCIRMKCPRVEMPTNGNVMCSGDRRIGTKCTFSCSSGYALVGHSKSTLTSQCRRVQSDGGVQEARMSVEKVECTEIRCQPKRIPPQNGQVYCSRSNFHGSRCIFSCDSGYDLDGTTDRAVTNVCEYNVTDNGQGKWSADPPTCSRFYCPVKQNDPLNGEVTCTDGSFMGSMCEFKCNDGYELIGPVAIICRDLAYDGDAEIEWSDTAPVCVPSSCPELWYDRTDMRATCNREKEGNGYPVGTKCVYECADFRYYIELPIGDSSDISCLAKNKWSVSAAPRCFLKTCPRLSQIENGNEPICTIGNLVSSVCSFKCNTKYSLSHNNPITCESNGRQDKNGQWNVEPPKCLPNECQRVPTTPRRGVIDCSNGAKLGSYCTLKCDTGYAPKTFEVVCQMMTRFVKGEMVSTPRFANEESFCCAECRSDFYITLAVDTRYKRGLQNVVDFTKIFLTQLSQRNNKIYFSAFAYDAGVNQSTAIDRTDIMSTENLRATLDRIEEWQVHKEGIVSDSSSALEYANANSFSPLDPSHANFLIVAAEDAPENVDRELIQRIRSRGIDIIVGVRNEFARIKWGQLLNGDGDVLNLDSNKVMNRMNTVAFRNGCSSQASQCV